MSGQEMDRTPIRVLCADDDARYRLLIQAVFGTYPRFELVAAASDGEEAVELARQLKPENGWPGRSEIVDDEAA